MIKQKSDNLGFIPLPLILATVLIITVSGGYFGIRIYMNFQKAEKQREEEIVKLRQTAAANENKNEALAELRDLKKELEILKSKSSKPAPKPTEGKPQSQIQLTATGVLKKLKPSVVLIEIDGGHGSGMVIDSSGHVLTNAHVIAGVSSVKVKLPSGLTLNASISGRNENLDIAILRISSANLAPVEFGNSDSTEQGETVYTLGYPIVKGGEVSIKEGIVSRKLTLEGITYLETSADIHPGNSGGPLVN